MRSVLPGLLFAAGAVVVLMPPATAQTGEAASEPRIVTMHRDPPIQTFHDLQRHMSSKDNRK